MIHISVIVPFFNVENYIGRCVDCLLNQTIKEEMEFIFVDDGSTDKSRRILEDKIKATVGTNKIVKIITHPYNKGLPAARNSGLDEASGNYVIHFDSDDYMELNMLESMYFKCLKNNADIAICDYYLSYSDREHVVRHNTYTSHKEIIEKILRGEIRYNVWNKLVKRSLYHLTGTRFPDGYSMGEDTTMIRLLANAQSIIFVSQPLYHYVQYNAASITKKITAIHFRDIIYNTDVVIRYLKEHFEWIDDRDIYTFQLLMKWPFLNTGNYDHYKYWRTHFTIANRNSLLTKEKSIRIKVIEFLAYTGQWWCVWLHYWMVIRLYYSIVYQKS